MMKKGRRARWREKKKKKKKNKKGGGSAPYLPGDIVHDILVMLPAKSVARFRAVSKSWHALTTDSSFILSHAVRHGGVPNRTSIASSRYFSRHGSAFDLFTVTATGDVGPRMWIPTPNPEKWVYLPDSKYCHGLQCNIGLSTKSFYICNILSKEWIAVVPYPSYATGACTLSFYFHASTGEYRLLSVFWIGSVVDRFEDEVKLAVTTVGKNTWRYLDDSAGSYNENFGSKRCITLNGRVHWLGCPDDSMHDFVGVFDTESEEFHKLSLPDTSWTFRNDVAEIEGRVVLCQVTNPMTMCIWELKDYAQEGKWIKWHTISFQGIKEAPDMFCIRSFEFMSSLDSDKQVLSFSTETPGGNALCLYDLKLKELKKIPLPGYCLALFSENTLISSKFFNKQEDELNALRSM